MITLGFLDNVHTGTIMTMNQQQQKALNAHSLLADRLVQVTREYLEEVRAVEMLERWDDRINDDVLADSLSLLERRQRGCFAQLSTTVQPFGTTVLAASPAFAGPGTRPYRIVLLQFSSIKTPQSHPYCVCTSFYDDAGGSCSGHYFGPRGYGQAMKKWLELTINEVAARDSRCWDKSPVAVNING